MPLAMVGTGDPMELPMAITPFTDSKRWRVLNDQMEVMLAVTKRNPMKLLILFVQNPWRH